MTDPLNMESNPPEPGAQRVMGDGREKELSWNERWERVIKGMPRVRPLSKRPIDEPMIDRAIRLQAFLARQTPPIVLTDGQALGAVRAVEG